MTWTVLAHRGHDFLFYVPRRERNLRHDTRPCVMAMTVWDDVPVFALASCCRMPSYTADSLPVRYRWGQADIEVWTGGAFTQGEVLVNCAVGLSLVEEEVRSSNPPLTVLGRVDGAPFDPVVVCPVDVWLGYHDVNGGRPVRATIWGVATPGDGLNTMFDVGEVSLVCRHCADTGVLGEAHLVEHPGGVSLFLMGGVEWVRQEATLTRLSDVDTTGDAEVRPLCAYAVEGNDGTLVCTNQDRVMLACQHPCDQYTTLDDAPERAPVENATVADCRCGNCGYFRGDDEYDDGVETGECADEGGTADGVHPVSVRADAFCERWIDPPTAQGEPVPPDDEVAHDDPNPARSGRWEGGAIPESLAEEILETDRRRLSGRWTGTDTDGCGEAHHILGQPWSSPTVANPLPTTITSTGQNLSGTFYPVAQEMIGSGTVSADRLNRVDELLEDTRNRLNDHAMWTEQQIAALNRRLDGRAVLRLVRDEVQRQLDVHRDHLSELHRGLERLMANIDGHGTSVSPDANDERGGA